MSEPMLTDRVTLFERLSDTSRFVARIVERSRKFVISLVDDKYSLGSYSVILYINHGARLSTSFDHLHLMRA